MTILQRWLATMVLVGAAWATASAQAPVQHFVNGKWFDGTRFVSTDWYIQDGRLTHTPRSRTGAVEVDLHGGWVVPPYGDAHEHMFDGTRGTAELTTTFLRDGIFYAQGMTNTPEGAAAVRAAGLVNTPTTVDVTWSNGGLTGVNGHPKEVYESLANGFYYPQNDAQMKLVIDGQKSQGHAIWQVTTEADLARDWPIILAGKPDLIKIYLAGSEHFKVATKEDPQLGKGINPTLVAGIVTRAHAAGLKVAAHVESMADIHTALVGGVDELGHLPGYGLLATEDAKAIRVPDEDIALMARRGVRVQLTAGLATTDATPEADLAARQGSQRDNARRMKAAGVQMLVGSDHYGSDSLHEAEYLHALGVWSNAELLRMWAVTTPQAIFPKRKIGVLAEGYEASFLVLTGNPLMDWQEAHAIGERWKGGLRLVLPAEKVTK